VEVIIISTWELPFGVLFAVQKFKKLLTNIKQSSTRLRSMKILLSRSRSISSRNSNHKANNLTLLLKSGGLKMQKRLKNIKGYKSKGKKNDLSFINFRIKYIL